jgi:SulP family sulfate permease
MVAAALAIATGMVCIAARLARLGFVSDLLSKPVLTGYMCGIGILMIISLIWADHRNRRAVRLVLEELTFTVRHPTRCSIPTPVIRSSSVRRWPSIGGGPRPERW